MVSWETFDVLYGNSCSTGRWFSPLKVHIIPKLGNRDVQEIDQRDIFEVLRPIWHIKADSVHEFPYVFLDRFWTAWHHHCEI